MNEEQQREHRGQRVPEHLRDAWDARPRGPAVFVTTHDGRTIDHGKWVTEDDAKEFFFEELRAMQALPEKKRGERTWRVTAEQLSLAGLYRRLRKQGGRA